jgi:FkbM family methyltransferase
MQSEWRQLTERESGTSTPETEPPFGAFAPNALQSGLIRLARATILRRGMFRATVTRLVHAFGKGKLDIAFRGASFRLQGERNLIEYGLLLVPEYNRVDMDFLLQDAPPDAQFIDLGCNIGLYALPLAAARRAGRVIVVDANPLMISRIAWNAAAGNQTNLTVVHAAVSDHEGRADLVIRKDDVAIVAVRENETGNMPVRTLASIVNQAGLQRIDGLKIDIEGHEDRALVPFLDQCPRHLLPARIVIEKSGPDEDYPGCTAAFARHGYRLVGRTRNNSLYRRDTMAGMVRDDV